MSLNVEIPLVRYTGSGTRGPFSVAVSAVPITYLNKSEIVVTRWSALGVPTVYTESTHYTLNVESVVTGEAAATVTLAMGVDVLGVLEKLSIERQTPRSQIQVFTAGGGFNSTSTERTLDRKTRIIQEIDFRVGRALGLHPLTTGSPPTLPQVWEDDSLLGSDDDNNLIWYTAADFVGATGETGETGAAGADGDDGVTPFLTFTYSTTTTDGDPGAGTFRLDHATIASATGAFIDNTEAGGASVTAYLDTFDDPTSTIKGVLVLRGVTTPTAFAVFQVTGSVVDGTGYRKLTLTHVASGGTFTNGETFALSFARTGDKGDTGPGTGDLLAANNLNDVADKPTARTNLAVFGIANNLSEGTPSTMRANLGLVIGTNVQAYHANLTTYAGIAPSANVQSLLGSANYAAILALLGAISSVAIQVFTSSGTYTPTSGMKYCIVECVGAGGGGGGVQSAGSPNAGGGGGGGAGGYARKRCTAADIGASKTVTVGAAGGGASAGFNTGSTGGATSVGALVSANGGGGGSPGGANSQTGTGGAGGTASGDFGVAGAPGGIGDGAATNAVNVQGGAGAPGPFGGGAVATLASNGTSTATNGNNAPATGYGGGGGGAVFTAVGGSDRAGGNGAGGIVIITEFV